MSGKTGSMTPRIARKLLTVAERYGATRSFDFRNWKTHLYGDSTSDGNYKLAIQNLANAYRLVCPSDKSADDFDNRILRLREQKNSEEDIYAETVGVLADCVCCADWLDC